MLPVPRKDKAFLANIIETDAGAVRQLVRPTANQAKALVEKLMALQRRRLGEVRSGERQVGASGLDGLDSLARASAVDGDGEAIENASHFVQPGKQKAKIDRRRKSDAERPRLALSDRGGERARIVGALVAAIQNRQHFLPKLGQDGLRTLPPEKFAAELGFKLLDRARE